MSEYTPTTEEVRDDYILRYATESRLRHNLFGEAFDRWLAAHDAEVAAKTLEDAADHVSGIDGRRDDAARDWLRARAAGIRSVRAWSDAQATTGGKK